MGLILRHHGRSVGAGVSVLLAYVFVLSSMPKQRLRLSEIYL